MLDKYQIYTLFDQHQFKYEAYNHPAVYTIDELDALDIPNKEQIVKNLFLRDDKKKNYYLVTLPGHKTVNLKNLSEKIPSRKLSFASEQKLLEMLGLERGHVTPLGVLNHTQKNVTVVFDQELQGTKVGIHPMENTATVFLAFEDVLKLVEEHGTPVILCDLD